MHERRAPRGANRRCCPAYGPDLGSAYIRADLTGFGQAVGVLARARSQVVVSTAAIPDPVHDPAHVVFATNCTIAFNVAEAVAVTQQRGAAGAAAGFTVQ